MPLKNGGKQISHECQRKTREEEVDHKNEGRRNWDELWIGKLVRQNLPDTDSEDDDTDSEDDDTDSEDNDTDSEDDDADSEDDDIKTTASFISDCADEINWRKFA